MPNELKPCKCGMSVPLAYSTHFLGFFICYTIVCVGCHKTKVRARTLEKAKEKWNKKVNKRRSKR
jgi:hypothetical protein